MKRHHLIRTLTVAGLVATVLPTTPTFAAPLPGPSITACPQGAAVGCWIAPFSEDGDDPDTLGDFDLRPPTTTEEAARFPTAVSASVLTDGRILYWNGFEATEHADDTVLNGGMPPEDINRSVTRVLDLSAYLATGADPRATARWTVPTPENGGQADLFCADQRHLPDGSVIAVGGTRLFDLNGGAYGEGSHLLEYAGVRDVRVFDAADDTWTPRAEMNHARWYPSMITLPSQDERLLVVGGADQLVYDDDGGHVNESETYDVASDAWTDNGDDGEQSLPLYPRIHVLPNGRVYYAANGQMWSPFGQSADQATWNADKFYDADANTWSDVAPAIARNNAFSAFLPLRPDPATGSYDRAEIIVGGGTMGVTPGTGVATPLTEKVTWTADAPDTVTRSLTGTMNAPRWFGSAVVLPTGETVAINGSDRDHLWFPGTENAVRLAEQYDPQSGTWTPLSSSARARTYHSSAVLLQDGSILVGGHAPHAHMWGRHHDQHEGDHDHGPSYNGDTNLLRDPSFEIFRPPYLYRGERPTITKADGALDRGRMTTIKTPDAGYATLQVVLSRLPSVTHITDADQRTVELRIVSRKGNRVEVRLPDEAAVLPDGPYYLFLIKDNGEGPTPSHAEIVQVRNPERGAAKG